MSDYGIQIFKFTFSGASITPSHVNVYTMDDNHVISCVFHEIGSQMPGVKWDPATQTANKYDLADGSYNAPGKMQTSTLTISNSQLVTLKGSGRAHTFTCKITVANTDIMATQTIHVFTPSKIIYHKLVA